MNTSQMNTCSVCNACNSNVVDENLDTNDTESILIEEYDYIDLENDINIFQFNLNNLLSEGYNDGIVYWSELIKNAKKINNIYLCEKCIIETSNHCNLCDGMCVEGDVIHAGSCGISNKNCLYCTTC
jgi:beta-N-acetylglucosaminidase